MKPRNSNVLLAVICFFAFSFAGAQTAPSSGNTTSQPSVQDIQRIEQKVDATSDRVNQEQRERRKLDGRVKGLHGDVNNVNTKASTALGVANAAQQGTEEQRKALDDLRKKQDAARAKQAADRRMSLYMTAGIIVLILATLYSIWRSKKATQHAIARTLKPRPVEIVVISANAQVINNPELPSLRRLVTPDRMSFFANLVVTAKPQFGQTEEGKVPCEIRFSDSSGKGNPLVFFPGEDKPVGWNERMRHAADILREKRLAIRKLHESRPSAELSA